MLWQGLRHTKGKPDTVGFHGYALATHHRLEDLLDKLMVNFHWIWRQRPLKEGIVKKNTLKEVV